MPELSARAFEMFMAGFGKLLKRMPQRDLWGAMSSGSGAPRSETETDRRLNELRTELRHFGRAVLRHMRSVYFFWTGTNWRLSDFAILVDLQNTHS